MSHQSTEFNTVEDVEYHYQICEGIWKKLNDLQTRRAELRRQFGYKLSRAASIKANLDKYLALEENIVEKMKQKSTRVSSKHKADLQQKHKNFTLKRKELLALWEQKKKPMETAKSVSFVKEATSSSFHHFMEPMRKQDKFFSHLRTQALLRLKPISEIERCFARRFNGRRL